MFLDTNGFFQPNGNVDDINIFFENAYWGVYDNTNETTEYIYENSYTSSADFFTITSSLKPSDTIKFSPSTSLYFYNSSFNTSSSKYSPVIDKFSVNKGDFIKFGKFEDPGEYYEVIQSTSTFPYLAILDSTIPSGSDEGNFAILRPKPDETSIVLEGINALGTEQIAKSILLPYDASDNLKNSVGDILKSVNTII